MESNAIDSRSRPATARLYYSAARLARALGRRASQIADVHGITAPQLFVLQVLGEGRALPNAVVARRIFVTPQAAHAATHGLMSAQLVVARADPANGRVRLLSLTDAGWTLLDQCAAEMEAIEQRLAMELGTPTGHVDLTDEIHRAAEALRGGFFGEEPSEEHQSS